MVIVETKAKSRVKIKVKSFIIYITFLYPYKKVAVIKLIDKATTLGMVSIEYCIMIAGIIIEIIGSKILFQKSVSRIFENTPKINNKIRILEPNSSVNLYVKEYIDPEY
ncbi:hypothetical protein Pars_0360 [Pyrobaculum arsenaticum DSM 13514]|nr:hypothetical protein Pars_0360 [Pyrobaculum arsenaticum DSM 13514]